MTNLLAETMDALTSNGKTPADVHWVGTKARAVSWRVFADAAAVFRYDSGYGSQEVRGDLVVVGEDWWLERREYDGSEWWAFQRKPERPLADTPDVCWLRAP